MTFPRILEIGPTKIGAFREPSWGCKRQLERRCDLAKLGVWSPDFLIWGSGRWAGGHRLKRLLNIIWNGGWIGVNHINLGWCCRGNNYAGNLGRNFKGDAVMPKIRWGGVHFEEQISFKILQLEYVFWYISITCLPTLPGDCECLGAGRDAVWFISHRCTQVFPEILLPQNPKQSISL